MAQSGNSVRMLFTISQIVSALNPILVMSLPQSGAFSHTMSM